MSCYWAVTVGIALIVFLTGVSGFDYCTIKCEKGEIHTMCKYPSKDLGPSCVPLSYVSKPLTAEDKKIIVDTHNELRSKVARGEETIGKPGPQPPAANMMEMVWDDEMTMIATRWVIQCEPRHDPCRTSSSNVHGGQNRFDAWSTGPIISTLKEGVKSFYNEVKDFNPLIVEKWGPPNGGSVIGHYTQLVWADSEKVGCGRVVSDLPTGSKLTFICNYGPGGNVLGAPMYAKGEACSQCPERTKCSKKYPGLCSRSGSPGSGVDWEHYTIHLLTWVSMIVVGGGF